MNYIVCKIKMISIEQDNIYHLQRFEKQIPHPSYIAGFIDGDGSIYIHRINEGYQSGISISQSRTNILQIMRYHFGGNIYNTRQHTDTSQIVKHKRNEYTYILTSKEYKYLIEYLYNSFIIKHNQYMCLLEFSNYVNKVNKHKEKECFYRRCKEYNICKNSILQLQNINIQYIQGLFDAEGCVFISSNLQGWKITITQVSYPKVLYEIQKFLGYGIVKDDNKLYIFKKDECLKFIETIQCGTIVKYRQLEALKQFLSTTDKIIRQEMYELCKNEKHTNEYIENIETIQLQEMKYNDYFRNRQNMDKVIQEIHKNYIYKQKSLSMVGEKNHNYGKQKSEETKKKMSVSIRNSKNGISDDTIIKVRELLQQAKPNVEIMRILNLSRHTVSRIKNGNLVCRNEEKTILSKTKEERNIMKRKIELNELLYVLDCLLDKNMNYAEILEYINTNRKQQNKEYLKIDILKNIKRKLLQNKLPIYETEISIEKYQEYRMKLETYLK